MTGPRDAPTGEAPVPEPAEPGEPPDDGLRLTHGVRVPDDALSWRFSRTGGPGGQKVNTSDTRVALSVDLEHGSWLPGNLRERLLTRLAGRLVDGTLTVTAAEHRSQWRNRQAALARLAQLLNVALREPAATRRASRPSAAARARRLADKRRRGEVKRARRPPGATDGD